MFAARVGLIQGSKTSGMRNLAARLEAQGRPVISFAAGELDEGTSEYAKQAAIQAVLVGTNKYTETVGTIELRQALAERVALQTGLAWTGAEIAVTAGAKQALFNTAMVLFEDSNEVIVPSPHWTTFPAQIVLAGARPVFVDTSSHGYELTVDQIEPVLTPHTKAIVLNTPNNPTGKLISATTLASIGALARERGLWVIFDQCYSEFVYGVAEHTNILRVAPMLRDRTVIIDSFSKSHALAGWRIGYLAAPPELVSAVANLQSHTTSNPNSIAQAVALALLRQAYSKETQAIKSSLDVRRLRAVELLSGIDQVKVVSPEGGFYVYLDLKGKLQALATAGLGRGERLPDYLLENAEVAVVGGDAFGDSTGIRLSYALGRDKLEQGLQRLASALRALR